jgi:hypothetical protein
MIPRSTTTQEVPKSVPPQYNGPHKTPLETTMLVEDGQATIALKTETVFQTGETIEVELEGISSER